MDQGAEAVGLPDRGVELSLIVRREVAVEVLEAQLQPGERGAQLVRGIGDERALGGEQRVEAVGHRGDRVGQRPQLGRAARRSGRNGEVAVSKAVGVGLQSSHRAT